MVRGKKWWTVVLNLQVGDYFKQNSFNKSDFPKMFFFFFFLLNRLLLSYLIGSPICLKKCTELYISIIYIYYIYKKIDLGLNFNFIHRI